MFYYLTNMKHHVQTIIHRESFGEDNWERMNVVMLYWCLETDLETEEER